MVAALLLAGCAANAATGEAADAAQRFVTGGPDAACGLLAPDTIERLEHDRGPCASVLGELGLPGVATVVSVETAGESAQVRFPEQVVFLARFPQGWLVTAAGCQRDDPDPSVPYECEVEP